MYVLAPVAFNRVLLKTCSREFFRRCVEYAVDVRMHGKHADTTGTLCQKQLFDSLKALRIKGGCRLFKLDVSLGRAQWNV